ncbi:MAG: ferrous iron transport protein A [Verrucomicrobiales bacterium]|jgi:Fe2+ transport system protein FeoA|nr:ferrous iron transport protein A [Verrucomicrobiales bacterium]
MKRLNELQPGATGIISVVNATQHIAQQLMVMGLLPGVHLEVVGVAPFGDPMTIRVKGRSVSLRRADASLVELE